MSSLSNTQLQALVDNLTSRAPKATFNVDGVMYTSSKIATLAGSILTARSGAIAAKGAWKDARSKAAEVEDESIPILMAARVSLVSMFSSDTSTQAALAVAPRKAPKPLTAEARVTAVAKNRATREVRGTSSKQQKAKLKGNVTGVVVTPVTSQGPNATSQAATPSEVAAVPASASPVAPTTTPAIIAGAVVTPTGH